MIITELETGNQEWIVRMSLDQVRRPTTDVAIVAIRNHSKSTRPDVLATEEPMEIRLNGPSQDPTPISITMRTPGNDFELAVGFLFSEGIITTYDDLSTVCYCANIDSSEQRYNVVSVELTNTYFPDKIRQRNFVSNSSCGICGASTISDLSVRAKPLSIDHIFPLATILQLPDRLKLAQKIFKLTGGLHGAGIFDDKGELEIIREDIGRHNALDKLIGHYFLQRQLPLDNKILVLSGRVGFELVQKAAIARIPVIVAVSAPSSLAVKTASEMGITIIGFTRGNNANIYSCPKRIDISL